MFKVFICGKFVSVIVVNDGHEAILRFCLSMELPISDSNQLIHVFLLLAFGVKLAYIWINLLNYRWPRNMFL